MLEPKKSQIVENVFVDLMTIRLLILQKSRKKILYFYMKSERI